MRKFFLSHAVKDKNIITAFFEIILKDLLGFTDEDVFFSSLPETGGGISFDWRTESVEAMKESEFVLFFHSEAFEKSNNCKFEMGWQQGLQKNFIPLTLGRRGGMPSELERAGAFAMRDPDSVSSFCERIIEQTDPNRKEALAKLAKNSRLIRKFGDAFTAWKSEVLLDLEPERAVLPEVKDDSSPSLNDVLNAVFGSKRQFSKNRLKRFSSGTRPIDGSDTHLSRGRDLKENRASRREELRRLLLEDGCSCIPTKYLYSLEGGWAEWLDMTRGEETSYRFYDRSLAKLSDLASAAVDEAAKLSLDPEFDYVSLGCGDGRKDAILLEAMKYRLRDTSECLLYFPLDISGQLLNEGINTVWDHNGGILCDSIETFPIQGDICSLRKYRRHYEVCRGNNFFALLGNTLGNSSESQIFDALQNSLEDGDFVLFEVNTDQKGALNGNDYASNKDKNWRRHTLTLRAIGVDVDPSKVTYRHFGSGARSIVKDTVTVVGMYKELCIKDLRNRPRMCENVELSAVHHYNLDFFVEAVKNRIGLTEIRRWEADGVGHLLARKTLSPFRENLDKNPSDVADC